MDTADKTGISADDRDAKGRFTAGNVGKPKGTPHRATRAAQALLNGEAQVLTRKAVDLALAGDVTALRLCIERLVPPCREARVHLPVPPLLSAADLPGILAFLLASAAGGRVTPGEAEKLARLTGEYAKAVELSQFEERLRRLEERRLMGDKMPDPTKAGSRGDTGHGHQSRGLAGGDGGVDP